MAGLSDILEEQRRQKLASEMTHVPQAPIESLQGHDPLTDWGLGVRRAFLDPVGTVVDKLRESPFLNTLNNIRQAKNLDEARKYDKDLVNSGLWMLTTGGDLRGALKNLTKKTEYEIAHEIAQKNAALPIEQGGLGLPPNNTAMDRAKAMGYTRADEGMEFMGAHRPPMSDSGAPLYDLTGGGKVYPDDIYSSKAAQYYGVGEPSDQALFAKLQSYKGKPDEMVTVFRAVPKKVMEEQGNAIHHGDWVTPSRQYAVEHGESALGGDYRIQRATVPAKSLFTNGDSPYEFGIDKSQYFTEYPASIPLMRSAGHNMPDRSRFAAFNPLDRYSDNVLAGGILGAIGLGSLLPRDENNY